MTNRERPMLCEYTETGPVLEIGSVELRNSYAGFLHFFGNNVGNAAFMHRLIRQGDYRPFDFFGCRETFLNGLSSIISARLLIKGNATYERLRDMIKVGSGDWWDVHIVMELYRMGRQLISPEDESPYQEFDRFLDG